jgi:hypothetical protein
MGIVEALVAGVTVLAIAFFALDMVALARLPADRRPATTTIDRLGRPLPPAENPDYRETEDERHDAPGQADEAARG